MEILLYYWLLIGLLIVYCLYKALRGRKVINIIVHPAEFSHRFKPAVSKGVKSFRVPHGLINQGATCFLNSVLQVLFMTPEVHQALQENISTCNSTDRILNELFNKLEQGECGTESITDHLQIQHVWVQRDAAEHLELLLNLMSPEASEPFRGELLYNTTCSEGHCVIEDLHSFWTLPLSLPERSSVQNGMDQFTETKQRSLFCPECEEETKVTRSCRMKKPPQILALFLKSFDSGSSYVEIPGTVQTTGQSYSLCGVVDHWGGPSGGHYTVTLRSEDGPWFHFNDRKVDEVDDPTSKPSHSAYLLLYRNTTGDVTLEIQEI